MRSAVRPLLLVALALSFAACRKSHEPEGPRVTVLFTTDEHSHLFAVAPEVDDFDLATGTIKTSPGSGKLEGGIARRAAILDAERAAAAGRGSEAVTFSCGDYSQGALSGAGHLIFAPDLRALKRLKYDAVAIGNHEFDVGPAGLALSISKAATEIAPTVLPAGEVPPLVLTNVVFEPGDAGSDALQSAYGTAGQPIAPSRVITLPSGKKIGVVAVLGVDAGTGAAGAAPVRFWSASATDPMADIISTVQPAVNSLRTQGVNAVIVLGHGGIGPQLTTSGETIPGDDERLAMGLSGIDLVLSGHTHLQGVREVVAADGRHVPVIQAPPYGDAVGRVDLVFDGDRPVLDPKQTAFVPVDDRTAPTGDAAITGLLATTIGTLESVFLPPTLTVVLGVAPTHTQLGDLYYRQIGKTDFDIRGLGGGETTALDLDTDAMLAIARALAPSPKVTEFALQNYGSIRADLPKGLTGALSFADVYRVVPNGVDPSATAQRGTPGFPLIRVAMTTLELRAALEGTLVYSLVNGDYFLGPSGLKVVYDTTRTPWDQNPFHPGWITSIALVDATGTETLLYDVTQTHSYFIPASLIPPSGATIPTNFVVNPFDLRTGVTTYYVGLFAAKFGVTMRYPVDGNATDGTALPSLDAALLTWDGTSHVKDHQALGRYVYGLCCSSPPCSAPGDFTSLPSSLYGASVPKRMACSGPLCP